MSTPAMYNTRAGSRAAEKTTRTLERMRKNQQRRQAEAQALAQTQSQQKSAAESNPYMDFPTRIYLFFSEMLKKMSNEADVAAAPQNAALAVSDGVRLMQSQEAQQAPAAARTFSPGPGRDPNDGKCVPCMEAAEYNSHSAGPNLITKAAMCYNSRRMGENLAQVLRGFGSPRTEMALAAAEHSSYRDVLNRNPATCLVGHARAAQSQHMAQEQGYAPTEDDAGAYMTRPA